LAPLHIAARDGFLDIVKVLLEYEASINGIGGWTPLHYAAKKDHVEIIELLLEKGADDSLEVAGVTAQSLALSPRARELLPLRTSWSSNPPIGRQFENPLQNNETHEAEPSLSRLFDKQDSTPKPAPSKMMDESLLDNPGLSIGSTISGYESGISDVEAYGKDGHKTTDKRNWGSGISERATGEFSLQGGHDSSSMDPDFPADDPVWTRNEMPGKGNTLIHPKYPQPSHRIVSHHRVSFPSASPTFNQRTPNLFQPPPVDGLHGFRVPPSKTTSTAKDKHESQSGN